MEGLCLSNFAEHFLTRAPRPKGWTCVAPGIGIFSEASLREAYSAEPEDAFRPTFTTSEEGEDWVTLVLPSAVGSVPADVSRGLDLDISSFDKSYGFGKAAVGRRAGLYIAWADERDGDLVQLVWPSGRTRAREVGGPCAWGPSRLPRLADALAYWVGLVEEGVWALGEDGVEEDAGWFDSHVDLANLNWDDVYIGVNYSKRKSMTSVLCCFILSPNAQTQPVTSSLASLFPPTSNLGTFVPWTAALMSQSGEGVVVTRCPPACLSGPQPDDQCRYNNQQFCHPSSNRDPRNSVFSSGTAQSAQEASRKSRHLSA